jgi:hypothetical protein
MKEAKPHLKKLSTPETQPAPVISLSPTSQTKNHNQTHDSITGVNPKRTHGFGLWGNERVVVGIRVDKELYLRFKSVSKRVFGSVCNPIESFMAAVVGLAENGVNPSNTVRIGRVVIERNLRERRKQVRGDLVGLRGVEVVEEPKGEGEVVVSKPKAEGVVVSKPKRRLDYSGWSVEELKRELVRLREVGDSVSAQFVVWELRKRGVKA